MGLRLHVVANDLLGDGGDLVCALSALDHVTVGNVPCACGATLCADGCGDVQVGDGELGSEDPGELSRRVEVVQRLDADGVEEVMCLAVPVQGVHDQLGL